MPSNGRERRRLLLGSLLIVGLLVVALIIFFLDRLVGAFQDRVTVVAALTAAPGVVRGTPVWIAGEHVGAVGRIEFRPTSVNPEARVALTLEIPQALREHLRAGTRVRPHPPA